MESDKTLKEIQVSFTAKEQPEGDGARVRRFIGVSKLENLDPFLMLDWFKVSLPAGFPDHPHRGFETVTYLISGEIMHEDFKGHKGSIGPGDIQWMTAGKGIVHSEMPASFTEPAYGFQLWINLDKENKMCDPRYQEFKSEQIPVYKVDNFTAKVIAGDVLGVKGPIEAKVPTYFIDFGMNKDKVYDHMIPAGWNSMIVVHKGTIQVQGMTSLKQGDCAVFKPTSDQDQYLRFLAQQDDSGFILLAGKPIAEPIVWRGPFVLNTKEQLQQTFQDFQTGSNGFEGADQWESEIKDMRHKKH